MLMAFCILYPLGRRCISKYKIRIIFYVFPHAPCFEGAHLHPKYILMKTLKSIGRLPSNVGHIWPNCLACGLHMMHDGQASATRNDIPLIRENSTLVFVSPFLASRYSKWKVRN
jgi:hypothetical protein